MFDFGWILRVIDPLLSQKIAVRPTNSGIALSALVVSARQVQPAPGQSSNGNHACHPGNYPEPGMPSENK